MSEKINPYLCNRIVQHIKNCGELTFDTADLEELGPKTIIGLYGWHPVLNKAEEKIIFDELYGLALRHEIAEVARAVCSDILSGQDMAEVYAEADTVPPDSEPALADG